LEELRGSSHAKTALKAVGALSMSIGGSADIWEEVRVGVIFLF
jgi:hypothetical protein